MTWITANWHVAIAMLSSLGIGGLVTKLLEYRKATRAAADELALTLVKSLQARVDTLERAGADERAACARSIDQQRELYEAKVASLRHEVGNYRAENQMLLTVLEMAPDKAAAILARHREYRASAG